MCWGRGNDEDVCSSCRYRKSCNVAKDAATNHVTVYAMAAEVTSNKDLDYDYDDLLKCIRSAWATAIGKEIWSGVWDNFAYRLNKILPSVVTKCVESGWNPTIYVRAQVEWLTPLLKSGVPLAPGMFAGERAKARFDKWVERRKSRYGDPTIDRTAKEAARKERLYAATLCYGHALCIGGSSPEVAEEEALNTCPSWRLEGVSDEDRLKAFSYLLGTIDSSLPHRVVLLRGSPVPGWNDIRALCDSLRHSDTVDEHADLSDLGEVL